MQCKFDKVDRLLEKRRIRNSIWTHCQFGFLFNNITGSWIISSCWTFFIIPFLSYFNIHKKLFIRTQISFSYKANETKQLPFWKYRIFLLFLKFCFNRNVTCKYIFSKNIWKSFRPNSKYKFRRLKNMFCKIMSLFQKLIVRWEW